MTSNIKEIFTDVNADAKRERTFRHFRTLNLPNISRSINIDATYMSKLRISDTIMRKCQVRTVSPTISSSVSMRDVNVIATTCRNSASNNRNAPYIIIPPEIT